MAMPKSAERHASTAIAPTPRLDLDSVYREHSALVSRWIQRLLGSADRAEVQDLLHEVFLVVERQLPTFRGDAKLSTWLYGIAVRVVTARRRKARFRRWLFRRVEPELQLALLPPETPLTAIEREQATAMVYAVLDELSERDRTLIILFELEGLAGDEIAAVTGLSTNNVWVALHRARERFKKAFARKYPGLAEKDAQHEP